ncbi:MAG: FHA domain-containing protein [Syntrophobacteraceae bacterium]|nr:FHA domain-containing protein [Syntrophobacteraceae bacterium]
MFKLELRFQNLTVKEYRLRDGDIRFVGRDPYSHIVIDDPDVSRNHAVIARLGDTVFLWDEGSKHGITVNGCPILCALLRDGDVVHIGANHSLEAHLSAREHEETAIYDAWQTLMATI